MAARSAREAQFPATVSGPRDDELTAWQRVRRRRRRLVDRALSTLFGLLAAAAVLYVASLVQLVQPVLG